MKRFSSKKRTSFSLRYQLLVVWICLAAFSVFGALSFYNAQKDLALQKLQHNVEDIVSIKVRQFTEWHQARLADAQMFSQSPFFAGAVSSWLLDREREGLKVDIVKRLNLININRIYTSILITDCAGNVLISTGDTLHRLGATTKMLIKNAVHDKQVFFTDFYECATHKTMHIDYISPLMDKSDSVLAIILYRVNAYQSLYPIVEEWPKPIENTLNYVVRYDGESVVFLNSAWCGGASNSAVINDYIVDAIYHPGKFTKAKNSEGHTQYLFAMHIPATSWKFVKVIDSRGIRELMATNVIAIILLPLLFMALVTIALITYNFFIKRSEFLRVIARERKLSNYYKEFQTIFYSIGDGVIITDTNGIVTNMNFEAVRVSGYRESDAFGKSIAAVFRIVHRVTKVAEDNPVLAALKSRNVVGLSDQILLINRYGLEIPISTTAAPIFNDRDEIQGVVLVLRDRSMEIESARRIKESDERFQLIMESTNDGLWDWNVKTDNAYFSPAYYAMLGYSADSLSGSSRSWMELLHPDDRDSAIGTIKRCIKGESDRFETEFRLRAKDGTWKWILSRGRSVSRNKAGLSIRMVGTHIDITERMVMSQSLKESEARLNLALRVAKMGYWYYHINTRKLCWYGGERELLGFSLDSCKESVRKLITTVHPDDRRHFIECSVRAIEGNAPYDNTFRVITPSGETLWLHSFGHLFSTDGKPDYIFGVTQNITEQKQNEATLRHSEEKYRMLFNNMTQGFALHEIILDDTGIPVDYRFLDVNDAFELLTGLKANIAIGNSIRELMPDTEQYWIDIYGKVALTGEPIRYENYSSELGRYYDVWAFSPQKGQFATIFSDITRKRQIEETLQKLKKGIEQSPVVVIITDTKGCIEYVNPRFVEVSGYPFKEVIGRNPRILNSGYHDEEFFNNLWTTIQNGNDWKGVIQNKSKTGKIYWESTLISPIKNDKGEIKYFIAIQEDITELKKTSEARRESDEQLRKFFEVASVGIVQANPNDGMLLRCNETYCKITGYSMADLLQLSFVDLTHPDDREWDMELFKAALEGKTSTYNSEKRYIRKDGSTIWVRLNAAFVRDAAGIPIRTVAVCEDITERKKNELAIYERDMRLKEQNEEYQAINEELTESNDRIRAINKELIMAREKAEENDRLKSAFLANMSHEIRTPMNGIIGFAELLKKPALTEEERETYVEIIKQSGQRLLDLINNLIDISKIEAGQLTASVSQVNISAELMSQYYFFKREAELKGICLLLQGGEELPDLLLLTDKQKFISIVTNLIKNAIKFTSKGTIDYGFSMGQDSVEFYVSDTGMGIAPKMQSRIFERFVQGDISLTRPYEGAGLGLAITKSYVELLGGKINFDSEENVGTTFYFTLPLNKPPKKKKLEPESEKEVEVVVKHNHLKIMIVEDDKLSTLYLQSLLEPLAEEMFFADSGELAVQLVHDNSDIDLILMDIRMPDISGLEATRRIRQFNTGVVILAQTAFALSEDREESLAAGCNDYLTKPIKPNDLFQAIDKWINSSIIFH
ncbi:MAG: PAS domain S-box protein [Bacteroidales bacterium]|nr:PAS domain S-box protein [Bacteroidales bacterium]